MQSRFALLLATVLPVIGLLHYYVGLRGWHWLHQIAPHLSGWAFWIPFVVISLAFPLSRFATGILPRLVGDLLTHLGGYWLFVFVYSLPVLALIDLVRALNRWFGFIPTSVAPKLAALTGSVLLLALAMLLIYGRWRALNPVVVNYDVTIPKSGGKHSELNVVLVSDTHLGTINGTSRLKAMVQMVNDLQPDLILLAGDVIDDALEPFVADHMPDKLKQLNAKLGTYAILGNHDPGGRGVAPYREQLKSANIQLLVDEWAMVDESFYVIGRNDRYGHLRSDRPRMDLPDLLQAVDHSVPLILMDHQPSHLEEAEEAGIDLLVSGHTHRGQFFPNNFITRKTFEIDWGYLQKGATHVIVSLGFGTWGPPVRIGNTPEIVRIRVRFPS